MKHLNTSIVGVRVERVGADAVDKLEVRGEVPAVPDVEAAADLTGRGDLRA